MTVLFLSSVICCLFDLITKWLSTRQYDVYEIIFSDLVDKLLCIFWSRWWFQECWRHSGRKPKTSWYHWWWNCRTEKELKWWNGHFNRKNYYIPTNQRFVNARPTKLSMTNICHLNKKFYWQFLYSLAIIGHSMFS